MKVKVIKEFIDKKENKLRKINELFDVNEERYNQINKSSYGPFIEKINVNKEERK